MAIKKYEEFLNDKINEELGLKDVGIAAAFLLNILSGSAQKMSDDQIKSKVISYSNDQGVINKLKSQGIMNASDLLKRNAEQIAKDIKDKSSKIHTISGKTAEEAGKLVKTGWAISAHQVDTIISMATKENVKMAPIESIVINYDAGNAFEPGRFILKESVKKEITDTLSYIHQQGIYISEVNIESSTDKQRVSAELAPQLEEILGDDTTDNQNNNLSKVRNNEMKKFISGSYTQHGGSPTFTQTVLFEKGAGELGAATPQDASARYVKITLYGFCCDEGTTKNDTSNIESKIIETFKLVKSFKEKTIALKIGKMVSHKTGKVNINNCKAMHKSFKGSY